MIIELLIFFTLIIAYYVIKDRKPKGMPPGPWEIPFLGNKMIFDVPYMMGLREKYGDVVTTRMAGMRTVLLYDYTTAKQAMASPDFADRPSFFQMFTLDDRKQGGVFSANGNHWQHDRRFLLRNLRNLGMGRTSLEGGLQAEAQAMVDDLREHAGGVLEEAPLSFRTCALNIIWQMVAGKRYDLRSNDVTAFFEKTNELKKKATPLSHLYFFAPKWLQNLIPEYIKVNVFKTKMIQDFFDDMKAIVHKHVEEGEAKLENGTDGDDVISEYLREMRNYGDDENSPFWRGALIQNVNDLFGAGSDTIFSMMKWTVFLMAKHPELVARMREQIDSVTPKGELVSLSNKSELPLVEAFVTEALRYSSFVILNVQRAAANDSEIAGYFIPKGTVVQVVNLAVHRDPKFWEKPEEFRPERFIAEDGRFTQPKEGFVAFGLGRRQCLGETLAKMEYFLFSAVFIQNFNVRVPEGRRLVTELDEGMGVRVPKDQPLLIQYRG